MNILISLVGIGGIIFAIEMVWRGTDRGINHHLIILLFKLITYVSIVGLFLIYADKNIWLHLIISGMVNFIIFHFIEAFLTQKRLVFKRGSNV